MTKFRPCIDLHSGQVKQIVGGTLSQVAADLKTNYVSKLPSAHYAGLYQKHDLRGGHVVKLGPGNEEAAKEACRTWPGGLQIAGGITNENAQYWIDQGADKVSKRLYCDSMFICIPLADVEILILFPLKFAQIPVCLSCVIASNANRGMWDLGDHHFVPLPPGQVLS